jgi:hypothetical protein
VSESVFVDNPISGATVWAGLLTALSVGGRYLWLVAWPRALSPDYSFAQIPIFTGRPEEWAALATLGVAVILALFVARSDRLVRFLAAATAIAFLPVSNLLFSTGTIMAERLMYLPALGVIGCAAAIAKTWSGKVSRSSAGARKPYPTMMTMMTAALVLLLAGFLAYGTWTRNQAWQTELALWTSAVQTVPNSFKAHSSFAEALYQADPDRLRLAEATAAIDRSVAILDTLPDNRRAIRVYRQAASYHFEHADALRQRGAAADAAASYRRTAALLERYLDLLGKPPAYAEERADGERMLSAALLQLDDGAGAVDASRLALEREPFNAANYRVAAAALIQARRFDEAAVALTVGVMVTGNSELRAASLDLYRGGLDTQGCAVSLKAGAPVLNPECPIVRRHICAAGVEAIRIQRAAGRPALAEAIQQSVMVDLGCR